MQSVAKCVAKGESWGCTNLFHCAGMTTKASTMSVRGWKIETVGKQDAIPPEQSKNWRNILKERLPFQDLNDLKWFETASIQRAPSVGNRCTMEKKRRGIVTRLSASALGRCRVKQILWVRTQKSSTVPLYETNYLHFICIRSASLISFCDQASSGMLYVVQGPNWS